MRKVYFSIDNIFEAKVADNATDEEIHDAIYNRLHEILSDTSYGDFSLVIEEE